MEELIDNEASPDRSWKPCMYEEAMKKIKQYKGEGRMIERQTCECYDLKSQFCWSG